MFVYTLWESAVGAPDGALWWQIGPQKPLLVAKGDFGWGTRHKPRGLWVQFPVGATSTRVIPRNGSGCCLVATQHEV